MHSRLESDIASATLTDLRLEFTTTPRKFATTTLNTGSALWSNLRRKLAVHSVGEKEGAAIIPGTFRACPETCRGDGVDCGGNALHRLDDNVSAMSMLGADVDDTTDEALQALLGRLADTGITFCWWHTHSHDPANGAIKARLLFPLATPMQLPSAAHWRQWAWPRLMQHLGMSDVVDPNCKNPSRVYYMPRKPSADSVHSAGSYDGEPLDWQSVLGPMPATVAAPTAAVTVPQGLPLTPSVQSAVQAAVDEHGPAVSGAGGNDHTYQLGARLCRDWALSLEQALPFAQAWNATLDEPWTDAELTRLITNGARYGNGDLGTARLRVDPVGVARAIINTWRDNPGDESTEDALITQCRTIVSEYCNDPLQRERILNELTSATGKNTTALALPRVKRKPPVRQATLTSSDDLGLDVSSSGEPLANLHNATLVVRSNKPKIYFDTFEQKIRFCPGDDTTYREWSDTDDLQLALAMQQRGLRKMPPEVVHQAIVLFAKDNSRDSLSDWLTSLEWDGAPRIHAFLHRVLGVADTEYSRTVSANMLKSMAARGLFPGCKADNMVVLEGDQGLLKSSAVRVLAGDALFAEARRDPSSKDFAIDLFGKWGVEIPEMDAFSKADVTTIKAILSCQSDRLRLPYGRGSGDFPRRSIFIGTTNKSDWARDTTGNRRFWPVWCAKRADLAYVHANREQLFAEAVALIKAGQDWWEVPKAAADAEQLARMPEDPWADSVSEYLSNLKRTWARSMDILEYLGIPVAQRDRRVLLRLADIMRGHGFVREVVRDGSKTWKAWLRTNTL